MIPVPIRLFGSYSFDSGKVRVSSGITIDETTIVIGNPGTLDIRINLKAVTSLQPFVSIPFLAWGLRIEHREGNVRTPIFLQLSPASRPSRIVAVMASFPHLSHAKVDRASWKAVFPC
jgi:hypothetical protein